MAFFGASSTPHGCRMADVNRESTYFGTSTFAHSIANIEAPASPLPVYGHAIKALGRRNMALAFTEWVRSAVVGLVLHSQTHVVT